MSSVYKTSRWVGSRPLRQITQVDPGGVTDPRVHLAKIYEALELVLESLWTHYLRFESAELGTLLLGEQGNFLAGILEQKTHGYFEQNTAMSQLRNYLSGGKNKKYPGHANVSLMLLAQARGNAELSEAADLCESIAESLRLVEVHLNQGTPADGSEQFVLAKLLRRWKILFPYSE
ncbi:MAG TPA: hypothetical protein VM901_05010 [Bdellovibrionota bacterium]|jgi:hypothetical protein|nr:hypothetical protein [Bdellovibrionota bacterium]